jgi:hypothetical protein
MPRSSSGMAWDPDPLDSAGIDLPIAFIGLLRFWRTPKSLSA